MAPPRGWLLLLSRLLIVWQPLNFAIAAMTAMNAWSVRGGPVVLLVLLLRATSTAMGVAAGFALTNQQASAMTLAKVAVAFSAATDAFVYSTPYFPNNRLPGDTVYYAGASLAIHAAWLVYLFCSRQVRELS